MSAQARARVAGAKRDVGANAAAELDVDLATAFARLVRSLTYEQSGALAREIRVLSAAVGREVDVAPLLEFPEGVRPRHSQRCRSKRTGGECDCNPPWEASVWSSFDKKKIRQDAPHETGCDQMAA